jgi:hypothetical protein
MEDTVLTQFSLKKGLQEFGMRGSNSVGKEFQQLKDYDVVEPIHTRHLSKIEKDRILNYLMFLKEKANNTVRARGCIDGRPQREYIDKEDASSPMVMTESVMITATVEAKEQRDVATIDVPGAFMQTDNHNTEHVRMVGAMADILIRTDPGKYQEFATKNKKGQTVIVMRLKKALYGTIKAAYLFWQKLTADLKKWGFTINPYDPCVANKTINDNQCTVVWHVDDVKISHVDPNVVTDVIALFNTEYAKKAPLTITRGKVHEYLGMTLGYPTVGKVKCTMYKYIGNMLKELPSDMEGTAATLASPHLFAVNNDNPEKLDEDTAEMFHRNVAKLLFLCKCARPDIQTAVSFLCTRVKSPDTDDYKKLVRVM